jgi:hypothetical protein
MLAVFCVKMLKRWERIAWRMELVGDVGWFCTDRTFSGQLIIQKFTSFTIHLKRVIYSSIVNLASESRRVNVHKFNRQFCRGCSFLFFSILTQRLY